MCGCTSSGRPGGAFKPILKRLSDRLEDTLGLEWLDGWAKGLPTCSETPNGVELYHTLRLYNLYKAFDMVEYGKSRYNLLGNGGDWFPGQPVDKLTDWDRLAETLHCCPVADRIPEALREAHEAFKGEAKKRLSEA